MFFAPFRGSLFNPNRVPDLAAVTCPPYDVIDDRDRLRFAGRSPFNMVRLLLPDPGDSDYREAGALLDHWRRRKAVIPDEEPRFYLYRVGYPAGDGGFRTATGVIGALAVLPLGDRVLPHEDTMPKTTADRLTLMQATRANLDLIIGLSPAADLPALLVPQGPPRLSFESDGTRHALFDITEPEAVQAISASVGSAHVAIADGHHRYTTALEYLRECGGQRGCDAIMAFVAQAEGSGLTIGPTHRVFPRATVDFDRLAQDFVVSETKFAAPTDPGAIVLAAGVSHRVVPVLLTPRGETLSRLPEPWREASAAVGREVLYPLLGVREEEAAYVADPQQAADTLTAAPEGAAALMAPLSEHAIRLATETGLRFPQKSTYFFPKPRSGLVMRCFDDV